MPTGLDYLCATPLLQEHANWTWWSLHYSSTSGTCQLDLMIFALLLYSGTCQLDLMIFGANENVCVRRLEFPPWNVLWSFEISMFGIRRKLPELPGQPLLLFTSLKRCRLSWWSITASCCWQGHSSIRKVDSYAKRCQSDSIRLVPNFRRTKTGG